LTSSTGAGCDNLHRSRIQVKQNSHPEVRVRPGHFDGVALIPRDDRRLHYYPRHGAHIRGKDLRDVAFAQGYVMAHDRLPQMDLLHRYGAGTLAEVFGALDPGVIDTGDLTLPRPGETKDGQPFRVRWQLPGGTIFDSRSPHYRDLLDKYYLPERHFDAPYQLSEIIRDGEARWELR
jgi:hypothetical protein